MVERVEEGDYAIKATSDRLATRYLCSIRDVYRDDIPLDSLLVLDIKESSRLFSERDALIVVNAMRNAYPDAPYRFSAVRRQAIDAWLPVEERRG